MSVSMVVDTREFAELARRIDRELGPDALQVMLVSAQARTVEYAKAIAGEEIAKTYNIRAGDVGSGANTKGATASTSASYGATATLTYRGRTLTLQHFSFSQGARVSAEIFAGRRRTLGRNVFVPTGGITQIPFKRLNKSSAHDPRRAAIEPVNTLSVPQMILNAQVEPDISRKIQERMMDEFMQQWNARRG